MKNKAINSKIEAIGNLIKSIKSKAENAKNLNESGTFKTLESDLEAASVLQKEVQTLKDTLNAKTQELKAGITKLKKSSKNAGKILNQEKKSIKSSKTPATLEKTAKSKKKPAKNEK
jgi:hypothetical protein